MRHLEEEEKILACYGEELPAERSGHLGSCAECAAGVTELKSLLDITSDDGVPEPAAGFEDRTWARLQWQLRRRESSSRFRWIAAAAALVLLVIGFGAGRYSRITEPQQTVHQSRTQPEVSGAQAREVALNAAAGQQLDRSSRLLLDVSHQSSGDPGFADVRNNAESLLASNRLVRAASRNSSVDDIGKLLDDIEPILVELAHSPSDLSAEELSAIQKRIASRELLFKLRVVSSTLREAQQKRSIAGPARSGVKL